MINHPNRKKKEVREPRRKRNGDSWRTGFVSVRDKAIKRWFGNLEVVEGKRELHLQPLQEDIDNAVPGDPANCAFSLACKRMYHSTVVLFFGTVAYIDLLDDDGIRRVHRFILPQKTKEFINNIDKGIGPFPAAFGLRPPGPGETLDNRQKRNDRMLEAYKNGDEDCPEHFVRNMEKWKAFNKKKKRLIQGSQDGVVKRRAPRATRVSFFRNGSGRVNFQSPPEQGK